MSGNPRRAPIFIHSTLGRSGTNYLSRMLALHPDCSLSPIPEDYLLAESHLLSDYVSSVSKRWRRDPNWKIAPDAETVLLRHLGNALVSFLSRETGGAEAMRLVSKTPNVQALTNFFRLFPDAYLLILIRDGRSVVESSARSFDTNPNQVTGWWAWSAGQILDFDRAHCGSGRKYCMVRYEDLVGDPVSAMTGILRFLDLDPDIYDFSQIPGLPVFGSSTTRDESGQWKWELAPDTGDLDSIKRWRAWSRGQHERFNWIAGDQLEKLGYEVQRFPDRRWLWSCLTLTWAVMNGLGRAASWLTARLRHER